LIAEKSCAKGLFDRDGLLGQDRGEHESDRADAKGHESLTAPAWNPATARSVHMIGT
jgi:hypothetical protein